MMAGWLRKTGLVLAVLGGMVPAAAQADPYGWPYDLGPKSFKIQLNECPRWLKESLKDPAGNPSEYVASSCARAHLVARKYQEALKYAEFGIAYIDSHERQRANGGRTSSNYRGEIIFFYGEALWFLGRKDEAYSAYQRLVREQMADTDTTAMTYKGTYAEGFVRLTDLADTLLGRDIAAEKALHPEVIAAIDEGWALYNKKDYAGSLVSYQRAAAADPAYCPLVNVVTMSKLALGDNAGVLADLAKVPANCGKPYMGVMSQTKGRALIGLGRYEEALPALDEAIRQTPQLTQTRIWRDWALEMIEKRDHPAAYAKFDAGRTAYFAGNGQVAMAALNEAVRLSPQFTLARGFRALATTLPSFDSSGEAEKDALAETALQDAEAALRTDPQGQTAVFAMGRVQQYWAWRGRNQNAIGERYLRIAGAREPGNAYVAKLIKAAAETRSPAEWDAYYAGEIEADRRNKAEQARIAASNAALEAGSRSGASAPQNAAEYCAIPRNVVSTLSSCIETYNFNHGIKP